MSKVQLDKTFEVTVTAIIHNERGKMLITKRSETKKRYPGLWTVPGGHIEEQDYNLIEPNKDGVWYNVLENAVKREVREEVGVEIQNFYYVTSMILDHGKVCVISLASDYKSGNILLDSNEAVDYAWVTAEQAKSYELIAGIQEELEMSEDAYNKRIHKNES